MRTNFMNRKLMLLAGFVSVTAMGGAAQAACNYQAPLGSCKLTADLKANGLTVITDTDSCAAVDYQLNGSTQRMYLDTGRGMDPNVTSASTGVNVLACKTYAKAAAGGTTTTNVVGTQPVQTSERIVNTNLVATGQRMVNVQVPIYEKRVYVERQIPVEKKVYVEKPVYIEKHIPVEKKVYVEKPVYVERQVPVEKPVYIRQNVPVEKPVYVPYYIKPQVDVRYNQVVQGLPAGVQIPGLPQPTAGFNQQQFVQPNQFQQGQIQGQFPTGQVQVGQVQPTVIPQQQGVVQGGFQPAGTVISTVPLQ